MTQIQTEMKTRHILTLLKCADTEKSMVFAAFYVNCRHHFSAWAEGMNNPFEKFDTEENNKLYKQEQKQRALERGIRHTKREVIGMQEAVDKCTDEKLKFELQQELDKESFLLKKKNLAYSEYCKANNLRSQSERTQIVGWEREQSKKSIAAAKRYEAAKGTKK